MHYKTVIFDLDGTLLDTSAGLTDSVNFALSQYSFPNKTVSDIRDFLGNGAGPLISRSLPNDKREEYFDVCFKIFRDHQQTHCVEGNSYYPGILGILEKLKHEDVALAVVSNKLDQCAKAVVDKFFPGIFGFTIGNTERHGTKPDPGAVFEALSSLGKSVDGAVMIGDTDVDVMTAKNSGISSVSVTWGFRSRKDVLGYGADHIVDTAEELEKVLGLV